MNRIRKILGVGLAFFFLSSSAVAETIAISAGIVLRIEGNLALSQEHGPQLLVDPDSRAERIIEFPPGCFPKAWIKQIGSNVEASVRIQKELSPRHFQGCVESFVYLEPFHELKAYDFK